MMNKVVRWLTGHIIMFPFSAGFLLMSVFIGRKKAAAKVGKKLTRFSALWIESAIPKITSSDRFEDFRRQIIRNFFAYRILYDMEVTVESAAEVQFKISNCPFTAALRDYGAGELCRYACAGDFVIAKKHRSAWKFVRTHSHGTDGECCNPRYFLPDKNSRPD